MTIHPLCNTKGCMTQPPRHSDRCARHAASEAERLQQQLAEADGLYGRLLIAARYHTEMEAARVHS